MSEETDKLKSLCETYCTYVDDYDGLVKEVDNAKTALSKHKSDIAAVRELLERCVGPNIPKRIINMGSCRAVLITYIDEGNVYVEIVETI